MIGQTITEAPAFRLNNNLSLYHYNFKLEHNYDVETSERKAGYTLGRHAVGPTPVVTQPRLLL